MKKNVLINIRVNQETKDAFQEVTKKEGCTMSEAIGAFMESVVSKDRLPMNIRSRVVRNNRPIVTIPFIKSCVEKVIQDSGIKVKRVFLFGSYATGKADSKSDVDLFIDAEEGLSLFDFANLERLLQESLGKKVDLVTKSDDEYFYRHIQRERIILYEKE